MSGASVAREPDVRGPAEGRYELFDELAAGGMGVIHRARDRWAQRDVAYKQLSVRNPNQRARLTALFQREYETLARLPHPNIVEVYDYGYDADGPYYAMELLSGADLTQLAPLPCHEACRVLRDIASALALVHSRRLIHRDVSPNNVRLTRDGRAKLIDFGALTSFGVQRELVGTPNFLAPECLTGSELDQRSDLYSLGAIAYWALTRRTAIKARSFDELLETGYEPCPPPSTYVPEIPRELDELVLSMLAREPLARPAHAAYVIDRLTAIAGLAPEADERKVAFSYLAHPMLAGREEVLDSLHQVVLGTIQGQGKVALVEGRAGLGRTVVLEEVARFARVSGATVLRAQGDRNAAPFAIARRLTQHASLLFPELEERAEPPSQSIAGGRVPVRRARSPVEVAERHAALLSSLQAALARVAAHTPLVLVIDDVQVSDSESLALLAALAESAERLKVTVIASTLANHERARDPAHKKLAHHALVLPLSELSEEQMVEFVHALFGRVPNARRIAQWLFSETGGVPATAADLANFLLSTGAARYTLGTFTLPHDVDADLSKLDVSTLSLARAKDLGEHAQAVAELLALQEDAIKVEPLARAAELPLREVLLSLEELSGRALATEIDGGYTLASSALRTALHANLSSEQQCVLHERLARALLVDREFRPEDALQAAEHLFACGPAYEAEAAELVSRNHEYLLSVTVARWIPLLERVLTIYVRERRPRELRMRVMSPLVRSGFYGDLQAQRRHIDEAIATMSLLSGLSFATKLRPWVGGKLALVCGLIYGGVRRARTPKAQRLGTLPEMISELVSMVIGGCATAASAIDSLSVARFVRWLDPLAALPKNSSGYLMREYCLAIAETSAGAWDAASKRYAMLIPTFAKPVKNVDEALRQAIYLGALNGRAQAEVKNGSSEVLALADELGRGDPFFAPHAECARMAYYAFRGESAAAEVHRARAEMLALRGGVSWSAVTVMTVRLTYAAIATRDAIGLVQATAELDRLSGIAPKLGTIKQLAEGWLEYLRGRPEQAVTLYERALDTDDARQLTSHRSDRTYYAMVLNAAGHHQRAREVCKALLQGVPEGSRDPSLRAPLSPLAIAEGNLGERELSATLMTTHVAEVETTGNPLSIGNANRDAAQLALLNGDRPAFDRHFARMKKCYRATGNPSLIQQCDVLLAQASRAHASEDVLSALPAVKLEEELEADTEISDMDGSM